MSKLKDFSNELGMTATEVASLCGYTRQGLYKIFDDDTNINKPRFNAALDLIKYKITQNFNEDVEKLKTEYLARMEEIKRVEI
jgi:hypothetical protein